MLPYIHRQSRQINKMFMFQNKNDTKNKSLIDSEKIRAADLARALGVNSGTIHGWIKNGVLPKPMKIGKAVMWCRQDIEKFLEECRGK